MKTIAVLEGDGSAESWPNRSRYQGGGEEVRARFRLKLRRSGGIFHRRFTLSGKTIRICDEADAIIRTWSCR